MSLINMYTLIENKKDDWTWKLNMKGGYITKLAYMYMQEEGETRGLDNKFRKDITLVWNKIPPLKVSAMAWRLL